MLGKKDTEVKISTLLGKSVEMEGDFRAGGSVRVDGKINGNVTVTGTLIVGVTGSITGTVEAASALIGGEVLGDVIAPDRVELTETAKVWGDITTNVIVIDEHAIFQGKCNMYQEAPEKLAKSRNVPGRDMRASKKSAKEAIEEALKEVREEEMKQEQDIQSQPQTQSKSPVSGT